MWISRSRLLNSQIVIILLNFNLNNRIIAIFVSWGDMKSTEFHRLVRANGWEIIRHAGSHIVYKKGLMTYPVPYHGSKELGTGLEKKMRKEMKLENI